MAEHDRLIVVILCASDLEASLRFYRDTLGIPLEAGFNVPETDPWYGGHHVELSYRTILLVVAPAGGPVRHSAAYFGLRARSLRARARVAGIICW